jgi:hypothetical protein
MESANGISWRTGLIVEAANDARAWSWGHPGRCPAGTFVRITHQESDSGWRGVVESSPNLRGTYEVIVDVTDPNWIETSEGDLGLFCFSRTPL